LKSMDQYPGYLGLLKYGYPPVVAQQRGVGRFHSRWLLPAAALPVLALVCLCASWGASWLGAHLPPRCCPHPYPTPPHSCRKGAGNPTFTASLPLICADPLSIHVVFVCGFPVPGH
jgi:hypothetical protein